MLTEKGLSALIITRNGEKGCRCELSFPLLIRCAVEITMRYFILLASILLTSGIANAEIYQWTDKSGVVHFTDNQDKIPPGYRNRAKEVDLTPAVEEKEPQQAKSPNSSVDSTTSAYGGHDENWWRSRFQSIREDIKKIQENLPAKRDRLMELRRIRMMFGRRSDRIEKQDLLTEIKNDEERIVTLQKELADLDTEASKNRVPLEWRK
jgi:hypothetical protein